jgi:hypothetical protein
MMLQNLSLVSAVKRTVILGQGVCSTWHSHGLVLRAGEGVEPRVHCSACDAPLASVVHSER